MISDWTLPLTILAIIVFTMIGAFIKGRRRDACVLDFDGDVITLEKVNGKEVWGEMRVEATGMELVYQTKHDDDDGHIEGSYMLYKPEYGMIQALVRYHDQLNDKMRRVRDKELKRTFRPTAIQRGRRKMRNFFKTVRDSLMDVADLIVGKAQQTAMGGKVLQGQQSKQFANVKKELIGQVGTAYEPLLERHIGKHVVLQIQRGADKTSNEYHGVLKDYTAEFIEVMDVKYRTAIDQEKRIADLVVPRTRALVRHLGE